MELLKLCIPVYYDDDENTLEGDGIKVKPKSDKYLSKKYMEEASGECKPHVWIHGEVSMKGRIEKLICAPMGGSRVNARATSAAAKSKAAAAKATVKAKAKANSIGRVGKALARKRSNEAAEEEQQQSNKSQKTSGSAEAKGSKDSKGKGKGRGQRQPSAGSHEKQALQKMISGKEIVEKDEVGGRPKMWLDDALAVIIEPISVLKPEDLDYKAVLRLVRVALIFMMTGDVPADWCRLSKKASKKGTKLSWSQLRRLQREEVVLSHKEDILHFLKEQKDAEENN